MLNYKQDTTSNKERTMPNHCHNRVTIWSEDQATIENLKNLFEDENIFGQIIPEPDWPNTPLMTSQNLSLIHI